MKDKIKIKVNKNGTCDEFSINGKKLGEGISKLNIEIDPYKPAKIVLETFSKIDIECEKADCFINEYGNKKIKQTKDGISIEVAEENHTFDELKQKLINYLYKVKNYEEIDVEIMKLLFK